MASVSAVAADEQAAGAAPSFTLLLSVHDELVFAVRGAPESAAAKATVMKLAAAMEAAGRVCAGYPGADAWVVPLPTKATAGPSLATLRPVA